MRHLRDWKNLRVQVSSAKDIKRLLQYAQFRNWAQHIHHPRDPPDGRFPRLRKDNWLHGPVGRKTRILGTSRHFFPNVLHCIASFDGLMMRQG